MAYKQPSSGLPFKELGSSPAKQSISKGTSSKVGPAESPEAIKEKEESVEYHSVFTPGSKGRIKSEEGLKEAKTYVKEK